MNVLIFTDESFPKGGAATNRILSYCHGLLAAGVDVTVLSVASKRSRKDHGLDKWINDVNIISFSVPDKLQSKIIRFLHKQLVWVLSLFQLGIELKKKRTDAVIFYGADYRLEKLVCRLCGAHHVMSLKEISEHPILKLPKNIKKQNDELQEIFIRKQYEKFDAILSMTNPIKEYLISVGVSEKKVHIVPQTVILSRFDSIETLRNIRFKEYIAYTGSLSDSKDGVLKLIKAYNEVRKSLPNLGLVIAGIGSKIQKKELEKKIIECGLTNLVQIIYGLNNNDIPKLICNAKLLVLCRPYSLQAQYGFPTKVAEYLATGVPVVTTAYGDMERYFKDKHNAYILDSIDVNEIEKTIIELFDNYDLAIGVGENGKAMAQTNICSINNVKIIMRIIEEKGVADTGG